jgi:hypothetical protein
MKTKSLMMCLVGLFLLFASSSDAEVRKWTRKNGTEFEAEFVKRDGPVVTLKKTDGTEITVKMGQLSEDDRKYVKQQASSQAKPETKDAGGQKTADKPAHSTSAEMRKWTRKNGKEFTAEFVKLEHQSDGKNVVTLRKPDGSEMTIRLGNLSEEDRKYVKQLTKSQGKPETKDQGGQKTADQPTSPASAEEPKHAGKKERGKQKKDSPAVATKNKPAHPTEEPASDQAKTMIVEAKGSGKDRDEALKEAFRDAVRKVVGAYVEEEAVVKNDQIIKDQVLTYSGGCVKTHGILSDYKDGSITIWALVEQDKVLKRLKAASVSVKEVAGGKIWDEIQSKRWKDKEATDLLRSVLKDFPANCMKAEVVGEPKHEDKGDKIEVTVVVRFCADEKAFEAFRERLCTVLDHVSTGGDETLIDFRGNGSSYVEEHGRGLYHASQLWKGDTRQGYGVLYLNTSNNESWTRLGWKRYQLAPPLATVFKEASQRTCVCRLCSCDRDGKAVPIADFSPFHKRAPEIFTGDKYGAGYLFVLAGTFFTKSTLLQHQPRMVFQQEIPMTENELKNLDKIRCELRFSEGARPSIQSHRR